MHAYFIIGVNDFVSSFLVPRRNTPALLNTTSPRYEHEYYKIKLYHFGGVLLKAFILAVGTKPCRHDHAIARVVVYSRPSSLPGKEFFSSEMATLTQATLLHSVQT